MKKAVLALLLILCAWSGYSQSMTDFPKTPDEALQASRKAYAKGYYNLAEYYADMAIKDSALAELAAEVKIGCMKKLMTCRTDSTKFLIAALELHRMDPKDPVFMKHLMDYFSSPGRTVEMGQFVTDELSEDSTDRFAWALMGELKMRAHRWSEAIGCYRKAAALDSTFVEASYNLGVCYSSMAMALKDSLADFRGNLAKAEKDSVLSIFRESESWLEKVRCLDPDCATVDWRKVLFMVYYVLGEKTKLRSLKAICKKDTIGDELWKEGGDQ